MWMWIEIAWRQQSRTRNQLSLFLIVLMLRPIFLIVASLVFNMM